MVVRTDLCSYTEYKIYPGRGQKFVGKDARISFFITAKADSLFHQRIKAVKLTWTQAWRRMNKKGKVEHASRKKGKKNTKFQKAIVGMSLEDMKRKRAQKTELRNKAKEDAIAEAKQRVANKSKKGPSKSATTAGKKPAGGQKHDQTLN
jgi:large subunit ribosomal protein L24e